MKKSLIIAVTVLGLLGCFSLYTSCKKDSSTLDVGSNEIVTSKTNQRNVGTEIYYSKNLESDVSYQLTISKNSNRQITIHREVISTNPEDPNAKVYYGYDDDVNISNPNGSTIIFKPQERIDTYLIPFDPNQGVENFVSGGDKYKFVGSCTCELAITNPASCQAEVTKSSKGTVSFFCTPNNCQTCKLHVTRTKIKDNTTTTYVYTGGFIIITGSSINEI